MKLFLTIQFVFLSSILFAQVKFHTQNFKTPKRASVNVAEMKEVFRPEIRYLEPSFPGGEGTKIDLAGKKKLIEQRYPRTANKKLPLRNNVAPTPTIIKSFKGFSGGGYPLDNHVAVSKDGQIVSCINYNIAVYETDGVMRSSANLNDFTASLEADRFRYDPKVVYDRFADRFIITMISGFNCNNSSIIVAFSQTNDASGNWNLYQLDGCSVNETWADYPMINYTENELILTVNQIEDSGGWRENFEQSIIWRINKEKGYLGESLAVQLYTDIEYNGRNIRTLCPVKQSLNSPEENLYFLSNRPLDIQNDSIWIIELQGDLADSSSTLSIDVSISDTPYGIPPNALQPGGSLQTNDARILDAVLGDDWIQFVFASIDTTTGHAAIYHGLIQDINDKKEITAQILSDDTEYAYPSLAYTGVSPYERNVIILASHSSSTRYAGLSCVYVDEEGNYSDWLTIKEGEATVDISAVGLERWGDYTASQSLSTNGHVFVTSSYGALNRKYGTWLAELAPPGLMVTTKAPDPVNLMVKSYPNPAKDRVNIQFYTPPVQEQKIALYDIDGKLIKLFHEGKPKKTGLTEFSFSIESLSGGIYFLIIIGDGQMLGNEKIVVN